MNLQVDYIDVGGNRKKIDLRLSRVAFTKHMAVAGHKYSPSLSKFLRTLGMLFHYSAYVQRNEFYNNRFSEPPIELSDPTEKGHFSNLAGKAIADYLSKKISNSLYTVNYEAAMRILGHQVKGSRPDLIAYSKRSTFALEAKGRSQKSPGNMAKHKIQSRSGPINVNFSVACISYDLFNRVKCNYHDPYNDDVPYDNVTLSATSRIYYTNLAEFLNEKFFEISDTEIQGESFFEINLTYRSFEKILKDERPTQRLFYFLNLFEFYRPSLILPKNIREFSRNGITNEINPFKFEQIEKDSLYVDNDRVGIKLRR